MKAILMKSNHGNHSGFNRSWGCLSASNLKICKELLKKYKEDNDHYYTIITHKDLEIFGNNHYGYMPKFVKEYFNYKY